MPSFEVEFEVFCDACGAGICHQAEGRNSRTRNAPQVTVQPCDTCMEKAKEKARQEGFDEGEADAEKRAQARIDELEAQNRDQEERIAELEAALEQARYRAIIEVTEREAKAKDLAAFMAWEGMTDGT
jgi:molecular chaperone GrpE (heat shock protein)